MKSPKLLIAAAALLFSSATTVFGGTYLTLTNSTGQPCNGFAGDPVNATNAPCPRHGGYLGACNSHLLPLEEIERPDAWALLWFTTTLQEYYPSTDDWDFTYVGDSPLLNPDQPRPEGKLVVDEYSAYNDCPGKLGAKIKVSYVPKNADVVQDFLWIQGLVMNARGSQELQIDDKRLLTELGKGELYPGVMPGPFYPGQDEDEEDWSRFQSDYDSDFFMIGRVRRALSLELKPICCLPRLRPLGTTTTTTTMRASSRLLT